MQSFLKKYLPQEVLGIIVILLMIFGLVASHYEANQKRELKSSEDSLRVAQAALVQAVHNNVARDTIIKSLSTNAIRDSRTANAAKRTADSLKAAIAALPIVHDTVTLLQQDSTKIVLLNGEVAALDSAYGGEVKANALLQTALDSSRVSLLAVTHAALVVDTAATHVVVHTKVPWFVKLAPKYGVGAAIGIDQTGKPALVVGFTFGWPR